jgi:putative peptide-modifying radical SAM enzyme
MHFFVSLTTECNLECVYCYGKSASLYSDNIEDFDILPRKPTWKIEELKKFIEKDSDPTIILYGGEPLMNMEKLRDVIENVDAKFILQTNGILLEELDKKYLDKIHCIQLSIDGDKLITNLQRGNGVYEKIIEDVKWLKKIGWKGEITARMAVTENTDIYKQVLHLINLKIFDSVHWQIDAMFGMDYEKRNFKEWSQKYNQRINKLIEYWIDKIRKGNVIKLYPFIGIVNSFLNKEKFKNPRCGAGWKHYAIMENGNIYPCPVMGGMKKFLLGNLENDPKKLSIVELSNPCKNCEILSKCGGRCLYANKTKWWNGKGYKEVCDTVKNLIENLEKNISEIRSLIKNEKINEKQFLYEQFNSCEIVP